MIKPTQETLLHEALFKIEGLKNNMTFLIKIIKEQGKTISILAKNQPRDINAEYQDDINKAKYGGLH